MADIQKRLDKAEKLLQKGKQQDALDEYLVIIKEDPGNEAVRQQAADLCLTLGKNKEAQGLFGALFDRQAAIGDYAKAVANYKKLSRLGSPTIDQTFKYAQLIEKTDKKQSLESYMQAVNTFQAMDRPAEALAGYKRVVALEPSIANHRSLAELAAKLGEKKAAAAAFLRLAELEPGSAAHWLDRGYGLDPSNSSLTLAYAKSLVAKGNVEKALSILKPLAKDGAAPEVREAYGQALIGAGRISEAEPMVWELFEKRPAHAHFEVAALIGAYLKQQDNSKARATANELEEKMTRQGKRREYINLIKETTQKNSPGTEFLEYMVGLYNSANREQDYCEALLRLFDLYFAAGQFLKAADCLDRAAEVDPYEDGNPRRLEMLKGKIDNHRFKSIAGRFEGPGAPAAEQDPVEIAGTPQEDLSGSDQPTVLEDLMLQAEIFMQYGLRAKAIERLERINKLFPREEEKNEPLNVLFVSSGFIPRYAAPKASTVASAPVAPASPFGQAPSYGPNPGAPAPPVLPQGSSDANAVDNFERVTEITRNIYRQNTVKGVLFTAVNDVGRHYNASRCIAGLCTPGRPPSAALEYCAPGIKQSQVQHIVKLLGAVQGLAVQTGVISVEDAAKSPDLAAVRDSLAALAIRSLLAVPLIDASSGEHVGLLMVEQCDKKREWRAPDSVVLKTIAEQMVLAVNNAKLRSLMKNLAVTDEKSGLLKRSSYLDVLLSEAKRALSQNSTACIVLLHCGKASVLVKEIGEPAVESFMQQVGQTVCSQIRQTDVAVRYDLTTISLILADTTDKNALFVVEKMRKVLAGVKITGTQRPVQVTVGIAEAVMQSQYDPIDIVTEVINRAEAALDAARAQGPGTAKTLPPKAASGAVA